VLVLVDGRPVLRRYRGSSPEDSHDTFSVGESIVSTLIGIAMAEGKLRGVDVTLAEALPQYTSVMRPQAARTTLRQLLTMTAGLRPDPKSGEPLAATLHGDWAGHSCGIEPRGRTPRTATQICACGHSTRPARRLAMPTRTRGPRGPTGLTGTNST
jgi:CubicO group peptidase (beta-lactamase class C family)